MLSMCYKHEAPLTLSTGFSPEILEEFSDKPHFFLTHFFPLNSCPAGDKQEK